MGQFAKHLWTGVARCVLLMALLAPAGCYLPAGGHCGPDGSGPDGASLEIAPPPSRFFPVPTAPVFGTKGVGDIPPIEVLPPRKIIRSAPPAMLDADPNAEESKPAPADVGKKNGDAPNSSDEPKEGSETKDASAEPKTAEPKTASPKDDKGGAPGPPAVKDKTARRAVRPRSILRQPAAVMPASHTAPRKPPRRSKPAGGW